MTQATDLSRRTVIMVGGGAALTLAGCSAQPAPTDETTDAGTPADGGGSPSADAGTGGAEIAKLADIPVGGSISATLDGKPILVSQPTAGTVVAFSAICTHKGCVVKPDAAEFACPCHGSRYDSTNGEVTAGPAPRALDAVKVTVAGDSVTSG